MLFSHSKYRNTAGTAVTERLPAGYQARLGAGYSVVAFERL